MPTYLYLGEFETFPAVRNKVEQQGVVVLSTSTVDNILNVQTDILINDIEPTLVLTEV